MVQSFIYQLNCDSPDSAVFKPKAAFTPNAIRASGASNFNVKPLSEVLLCDWSVKCGDLAAALFRYSSVAARVHISELSHQPIRDSALGCDMLMT